MADVKKSKRKRKEGDKLVAESHLFELRDALTFQMMCDWGFDEERYGKQIEKFTGLDDTEAIQKSAEKMKMKRDRFYDGFIKSENEAVKELLRSIQTNFTIANEIYPSATNGHHQLVMEFCERRKHMDLAIANCHALKQEVQYIIRTLPVDKNKSETFSDKIEKQIALIKGVRQADNRFMK